MWRSFFYSAGIGLFVLGLQALVIDHVVVPKNTKVQNLIRKILADDKPANGGNMANPQAVAAASNQAYNNFGSRFGASRFGPSQYSGSAFGTGYGGQKTSPQDRPAASSGYQPQGNNAQLAGYQTAGSNAVATKKPSQLQKLQIREWMPWSLLASGAIIFLYTHTHHRRKIPD